MRSKTNKLLNQLMKLHPKYIDLSLGRLNILLKKLGNPHKSLPTTIHIAGTNGKGSTLSFINNILVNNNYSVHSYISPHLSSFNERITLNNKQITTRKLYNCLLNVKKINGNNAITFFEITTAAAFVLFAKHKADFLLLETGLGGRLDATNIIPKKIFSIITAISIDHEEFLGKTLKKITAEKLGIVRNTENVIIAKQKKEVHNFIAKKLKKQKNVFYFNKNFKFKLINSKNFFFKFEDIEKVIKKPQLQGTHQLENASTAIAATMILRRNNYSINLNSLGKSIYNTKWPGRIEKIQYNNKFIIFDGSHNLAGAEKLNKYLIENNIKPNVIFGMLDNKNAFEFLAILKKNIDTLYPITIPGEPNAFSKNEIYNISSQLNINCIVRNNFRSINQSIMKQSNKYILFTGSLYFIGKVREKYL